MKSGLYTGRFQPFHLGHLSAIKQALEKVDRLYIGIGSSQYSHEPANPFTAEERREMIEVSLKANQLEDKGEVFLIPDIHNNEKWTNHVQSIVPPFDMVFVGKEGLVKELFEKDGTPVVVVKKEIDISATQLRDVIKKGSEWKQWVEGPVAKVLENIDAPTRLKQYDRKA